MKITHLALAFASVGVCCAQSGIQIRAAGPLPGGPFDGKVVTGKPFTASVETQTIQTLADGSHIINKQTITIARDSQGRTRREETLPLPPDEGQQTKIVFISDPVAQANYVLGKGNVAHKFPFSKMPPEPGIAYMATDQAPMQPEMAQVRTFAVAGGPASEAGLMVSDSVQNEPGESTKESLGTLTVNGVQADGTRTTLTIPAGKIGNDSPLVITDERWYSKDLQMTVMSNHTDPRFGESSYELTNIQRTEPAASMFQVPAEYTIEQPR